MHLLTYICLCILLHAPGAETATEGAAAAATATTTDAAAASGQKQSSHGIASYDRPGRRQIDLRNLQSLSAFHTKSK